MKLNRKICAKKKGSVELSMETFILLVVAIVILIAAYFIYTRGIGSVKEFVCDGLSSILAEIFETVSIGASSTVC